MVSHRMVSCEGSLSSRWSHIRSLTITWVCVGGGGGGGVIRVVLHQTHWSFTRVVFHLGGSSLGWSFIWVVLHQGGLSSEWFFTRVVFHWGGSSRCGLSFGWSFVGVIFQ